MEIEGFLLSEIGEMSIVQEDEEWDRGPYDFKTGEEIAQETNETNKPDPEFVLRPPRVVANQGAW